MFSEWNVLKLRIATFDTFIKAVRVYLFLELIIVLTEGFRKISNASLQRRGFLRDFACFRDHIRQRVSLPLLCAVTFLVLVVVLRIADQRGVQTYGRRIFLDF